MWLIVCVYVNSSSLAHRQGGPQEPYGFHDDVHVKTKKSGILDFFKKMATQMFFSSVSRPPRRLIFHVDDCLIKYWEGRRKKMRNLGFIRSY